MPYLATATTWPRRRGDSEICFIHRLGLFGGLELLFFGGGGGGGGCVIVLFFLFWWGAGIGH